jgi:hypothetical protein
MRAGGRMLLGTLGALAAGLPLTTAAADSFTPVRLHITIAPVARLHKRLAVKVHVTADPGVLDTRTGPLRVRVKLARECGGTYRYTRGDVLLDKRLRPQPTTGRAYSATATGAGKPTRYGEMTVCTWLEEGGDQRVFASSQSVQVDVSKSCTRAAARYDAARRKKQSKQRITADRRRARRACGDGVPL